MGEKGISAMTLLPPTRKQLSISWCDPSWVLISFGLHFVPTLILIISELSEKVTWVHEMFALS